MLRITCASVALCCLVSVTAYGRETADVSPRSLSSSTVKIWCKDGAFYRGEPVEIVPRHHVTLLMHDGRTLRIDWPKIANAEGLSTPAKTGLKSTDADDGDDEGPHTPNPNKKTPAVDPSSTPPLPPAMVNPVGSMPMGSSARPTSIRATGIKDGAHIEYLARSMEVDGTTWPMMIGSAVAEDWRPLCVLPCTAKIDPEVPVRVRGLNIQTSDKIFVPTKNPAYEMEIKPGYKTTRTAAWAVFGVGVGVLGLGGILAGVGFNEQGVSSQSSSLKLGGGLTAGAGLAMMIASIPVFVKSTTTVEFFRE